MRMRLGLKRILAFVLVLAMLFSLAACGGKKEEKPVDDRIADIAKALMGMEPVLDSVALYEYNYGTKVGGKAYDPQDSNCFWKTMWILAEVYGTNNEDVIYDLAGFYMPKGVIDEYGHAMDAAYESEPALPAGTSIEYLADEKQYLLPPSEAWLAGARYLHVDQNDDGDYVLEMELLDLSQTLSAEGLNQNAETPVMIEMRFTLAVNEYALSLKEPIFEFSVKSAEVL